MALYRMAQEAISNVLRHAQATQARIALDFATSSVNLTVTDNGRGFQVPESPAEFAPQGHFGLLGLHERAELVGGRLEIESTAGQGTRVRVVLPLPPGDEPGRPPAAY
jgi:two-component system sensor histidine kinase DegS